MRSGPNEQFVEEKVTILTEGERVEGMLFYAGATRLSDFLNSSFQQEVKFLKIKDPTVFCRTTGTELSKVPFLMLDRSRIVMILTHSRAESSTDEPNALAAGPMGRRPEPNYFR